MRETIDNMYGMAEVNISQMACDKLDHMLERCTVNLVSNLTRISRPTLYRWLDPGIALDQMNYRDAAWFILVYETSPKIKILLDRPPMSHPRLAKRVIDEAERNAT